MTDSVNSNTSQLETGQGPKSQHIMYRISRWCRSLLTNEDRYAWMSICIFSHLYPRPMAVGGIGLKLARFTPPRWWLKTQFHLIHGEWPSLLKPISWQKRRCRCDHNKWVSRELDVITHDLSPHCPWVKITLIAKFCWKKQWPFEVLKRRKQRNENRWKFERMPILDQEIWDLATLFCNRSLGSIKLFTYVEYVEPPAPALQPS